MAGTLYVCATPIGNLEDMTLRGIRTLKEVDLIAAEDTRNSIKLLNHFEIKTPMTSYHEHNKIEKGKKIVEWLLEGKEIALISDAGTPGISDPGEELVRMCREAGITVTGIPGPAACILGLSISGFSSRRFVFEGFLPADKKEKQRVLESIEKETRTMVFYEAPHRLRRTLEELQTVLGDRRIGVCRELTKKHESLCSVSIGEALVFYEKEPPRGECVILVEGISPRALEEEECRKWEKLSLGEHMDIYLQQGMEKKEAMKQVAKDRKMGKREIYRLLLSEESQLV